MPGAQNGISAHCTQKNKLIHRDDALLQRRRFHRLTPIRREDIKLHFRRARMLARSFHYICLFATIFLHCAMLPTLYRRRRRSQDYLPIDAQNAGRAIYASILMPCH